MTKSIIEIDNNKISDLKFDEERALYGVDNVSINRCIFDGPKDGESALKGSSNINVVDCDFRLRYPFWHVTNARIENSRMTDGCRASLWYDNNVQIKSCDMTGIKAVRECENITIENCKIQSEEFGWYSHDIKIKDTDLVSEYPFLNSSNLQLDEFILKGKYSFQYVENVEIKASFLDTKDAFWHSKNVTIKDSVVKGEYLGWYSENLKFVRCKIIGTQPLCYAKGLMLEDCEMIDCDLSFEKSDVQASILGSVDSIKNPESGFIRADSIKEIIMENNSSCIIESNEKTNNPITCCCCS
ncbi:MAG: DUF3737 family protein [Ignavibacteria bacterium]|jgi:hypothetical protein